MSLESRTKTTHLLSQSRKAFLISTLQKHTNRKNQLRARINAPSLSSKLTVEAPVNLKSSSPISASIPCSLSRKSAAGSSASPVGWPSKSPIMSILVEYFQQANGSHTASLAACKLEHSWQSKVYRLLSKRGAEQNGDDSSLRCLTVVMVSSMSAHCWRVASSLNWMQLRASSAARPAELEREPPVLVEHVEKGSNSKLIISCLPLKSISSSVVSADFFHNQRDWPRRRCGDCRLVTVNVGGSQKWTQQRFVEQDGNTGGCLWSMKKWSLLWHSYLSADIACVRRISAGRGGCCRSVILKAFLPFVWVTHFSHN